MKLVFVSNFLNHHQVAFCERCMSLCDDLKFIATENRHNLGYQTSTDADYVVHWYNEAEREYAQQLILDADAVIYGSCPNHLISLRLEQDKLSFFYSERFFKKGTWRRFIPQTRKGVIDRIVKHKNKPIYILSASAYLPLDLKLLHFPESKFYKWGYFPKAENYNIEALISEKKEASLLWAGRLLDWKHPDIAIEIAKRLRDDGYSFTLNIAGDGEMQQELENKIKAYNLSDCVKMAGRKTPEGIRSLMEQADIFLFTSDFNEGWGAILNEAMNSGCAVIANHAAGSTRYLVESGVNGYIYENGNVEDIYNKVKLLLDNPQQKKAIQKKAYNTIASVWNVDTAAERFLELVEDITAHGGCDRYDSGPCSRAEVFKEKI